LKHSLGGVTETGGAYRLAAIVDDTDFFVRCGREGPIVCVPGSILYSLSDGRGHLTVPIIDTVPAILLDGCVRHLASVMGVAFRAYVCVSVSSTWFLVHMTGKFLPARRYASAVTS